MEIPDQRQFEWAPHGSTGSQRTTSIGVQRERCSSPLGEHEHCWIFSTMFRGIKSKVAAVRVPRGVGLTGSHRGEIIVDDMQDVGQRCGR